MGKESSWLGLFGDFLGAMGNEIDIFSGGSSSSSAPSGSGGSGKSSDSKGSYAGHTGGSDSWGVSESFDKHGNSKSHTVRQGNVDRHYNGGLLGWIDSLMGSNSTGHSVHNGDRINRYDSDNHLKVVSRVQEDGIELHYDTNGSFIGAFVPEFGCQLEPEEAEVEGYDTGDIILDDGSEEEDIESANYWHNLLESDINDLARVVADYNNAKKFGNKEEIISSRTQLRLDCERLILLLQELKLYWVGKDSEYSKW